MARMSVQLTLSAVRAEIKDVTRRAEHTWAKLKAGDILTLIEKGMGLRKGEKQVVVRDVRIVDVRLEPLSKVTDEEVIREGLGREAREAVHAGKYDTMADWFVAFWLSSHGYRQGRDYDGDGGDVVVRRIEWEYL